MELEFDTDSIYMNEEWGMRNPFGIALEENTIMLDKRLEITFRRTIRVPDNDQTSHLPPNLGEMTLTNVNQVASKLPDAMAAKGGLLMAMHGKLISMFP